MNDLKTVWQEKHLAACQKLPAAGDIVRTVVPVKVHWLKCPTTGNMIPYVVMNVSVQYPEPPEWILTDSLSGLKCFLSKDSIAVLNARAASEVLAVRVLRHSESKKSLHGTVVQWSGP